MGLSPLLWGWAGGRSNSWGWVLHVKNRAIKRYMNILDQPLHANGLSTTQLLLPGLIELCDDFLSFLLMKFKIVVNSSHSPYFMPTSTYLTSHFPTQHPFLPWASRWPPRWPGWRCDRGGCWWTRHDWTVPRAKERGSYPSWRWSLWRDHPFDWQPGDYSQSSCNRTGLPEREALRGRKQGRKEGRKDRRREGRSRRQVIEERHQGLRGTRGKMDIKEKNRGTTGRSTKKRRESSNNGSKKQRSFAYQSHRRQREKSNSNRKSTKCQIDWKLDISRFFFLWHSNTQKHTQQARKHENVMKKKRENIHVTTVH